MKPNAYTMPGIFERGYPFLRHQPGVILSMEPNQPFPGITIQNQNHPLPPFIVANEWAMLHYKQWLQKRAYKHVLRDKNKFPQLTDTVITINKYLLRIHNAVIDSKGNDYYTNEPLDWGLILKLTSDTSRKLKSSVKEKFRLLPVVVHHLPDNPRSPFRICSFETFDYMKEKDIEKILEFSSKVIRTMNKSRM